jgi:hypothetical protein
VILEFSNRNESWGTLTDPTVNIRHTTLLIRALPAFWPMFQNLAVFFFLST